MLKRSIVIATAVGSLMLIGCAHNKPPQPTPTPVPVIHHHPLHSKLGKLGKLGK